MAKVWTLPMMVAMAFEEDDGRCNVQIGRTDKRTDSKAWLECRVERNDVGGTIHFYYSNPAETQQHKQVTLAEAQALLLRQKALTPTVKEAKKIAKAETKAAFKAGVKQGKKDRKRQAKVEKVIKKEAKRGRKEAKAEAKAAKSAKPLSTLTGVN